DQRMGESVVIRDESGTIFAETPVSIVVKPDEQIDLWGTPVWDGARLYLREATLRSVNGPLRWQSGESLAAERPAQLPTLTTAQAIRDLPTEKAAWKYPARLRGIITFSLTDRRCYLQDETSGIY